MLSSLFMKGLSMSDAMNTPQRAGDSLPAWISAGVVGLAVGIGGTYLAFHNGMLSTAKASAATPTTAPPIGPPPGGGSMGGGMMGGGMGGMMGMGGGGGGGGGGAKRSLTQLVGKLELLSRPDLKLNVDLAPDQTEKIAAKLDQLAKAEKMTGEEAEEHLADLEGVLSEEQKATLAQVGLPPPPRGGGGGRPGGGGPPGAGGPPGGAPAPAMGGMGGMMGSGPPPDENPFGQEANQKRLSDLLGRLNPGAAAKEAATEDKKEEPKTEEATEAAADK
jgi:hypothetical protein